MKKFLVSSMMLLMSLMVSAQTSTIEGRLKDYKETDTVLVYMQEKGDIDTVKLDNKGRFTYKADVKDLSEALVFLFGRGGEGRDHSCCILVVPGESCGVTLSTSKPDANGKMKLLAEFKGNDSAKQEYANLFYNLISQSSDLTADELVKQASYADCKKHIETILEPLRAAIGKIKDKDFAKQATDAVNSQADNALLSYAVAAQKAGKNMEADNDFMAFVNSIDKNDTLQAGNIVSYLQWYQAAHGDKYLPLTGEAAQLKHLSEYTQNQDVRNKVANSYLQSVFFYASFGVSPSAPDFQGLYEQYLQVSTDTTYTSFVTEQLEKMKMSAAGQEAVNFTLADANDKTCEFKDIVGKGAVTYVDFWATWCGPCKREIPYLATMAEHFKGNDKVRIISISIDADHDAWKKMIGEDKPAWAQYIIPDLTTSEAIKSYDINSIPRFMIFDAEGKLYNGNASRPSQEETTTLIESLIK